MQAGVIYLTEYLSNIHSFVSKLLLFSSFWVSYCLYRFYEASYCNHFSLALLQSLTYSRSWTIRKYYHVFRVVPCKNQIWVVLRISTAIRSTFSTLETSRSNETKISRNLQLFRRSSNRSFVFSTIRERFFLSKVKHLRGDICSYQKASTETQDYPSLADIKSLMLSVARYSHAVRQYQSLIFD